MMKKIIQFASLSVVLAFVAGCNAKGSSAPPPTNVNVVAGDSSATVTWDVTPGVDYWIFLAPDPNVTPQNCSSIAGCQIITHATSPFVISSPFNGGTTGFTTNSGVTGLTNGMTFSVSINGRINNGPGGTGSAAVAFTPRLAGPGSTWTSATAGTATLRGVASGTATVAGVTGQVLVAVGDSASLFSSKDGSAWTAPVSGVPVTSNLSAASASGTTYVVVGAGGVILTSPDAATWTQQTSCTGCTSDLYGLASNGAGGFVAVGAGGAIIYSNGNSGTSWTTATSGTTNALYGVGYANGMYVAVGQNGVMRKSIDNGVTWSVITPTNASPAASLYGVAYGGASTTGNVTTGTNTFVAVGAGGTLVTSIDGGTTWITQSAITGTPNLNAIAYGHQFIAVGDLGVVYTSMDGINNWTAQSLATTPGNLYAIKNRRFDYAAVGVAGAALLAK